MNCIDLTSKRSKMLSYVAKHSKQRKTTKVIKIQLLASIRRRKDKKCRVKSQNIKTTPNYESDQITMNCIDLTSKRSKMLSYVAKHAKQRKTTKASKQRSNYNCIMSKRSKQLKTTKTIKLQWIASIWRHNDKNVELRRNAFKTTQNYKSNQITMTCIYLMSKHWKQPKTKIVIILRWICIYLMSNRSKMLSYVSMHSKQHKTTKVIKLQWLASIWCQNILNYKNQNTKTCIDFMSNRSKQLKTTKAIKLQCIASNWRQNDQKCCVSSQNIRKKAKLQK